MVIREVWPRQENPYRPEQATAATHHYSARYHSDRPLTDSWLACRSKGLPLFVQEGAAMPAER